MGIPYFHLQLLFRKDIFLMLMKNSKSYKSKSSSGMESKGTSPWRPCPAGQHWRRAHYQSTYTTKSGKVVRGPQVRAGCCENPSRKDQIYSEELKIIAKKFSFLK